MDKLLQPDTGLMIWTVVTFLLLVAILSKAAWKPILAAVNDREQKIRSDLDRAEQAQKSAEELRVKYEMQSAEAQRTIQEMIQQARKDADRTRAELLTTAKDESERILEKGRRELTGETDKLRALLRSEVSDLSVSIAEKILNRAVDKKVQEEVLKASLKDVAGVKG